MNTSLLMSFQTCDGEIKKLKASYMMAVGFHYETNLKHHILHPPSIHLPFVILYIPKI